MIEFSFVAIVLIVAHLIFELDGLLNEPYLGVW